MIQRIQSVWLLLAGISMALTFKLPFYTGTKMVNAKEEYVKVFSSNNFIGLILAIAFVAICFITIFLFKNRKLQMQLVGLAIVLGILNIYFLYSNTSGLTNGTYSISAIFPIIAVGFSISALRSIWQDHKKLKDLNSNRLR